MYFCKLNAKQQKRCFITMVNFCLTKQFVNNNKISISAFLETTMVSKTYLCYLIPPNTILLGVV